MLVLAFACKPDAPPPQHTSDTTSDTGITDTQPTHPFSDSGTPVQDPLSGFSSRLNPQIGSIVYAAWIQRDPGLVHLEYSVDPDVWLSTPNRTTEPGTHEQILLGIPYGADVTWRVVEDTD